MTDQHRAATWIEAWPVDPFNSSREAAADALASEFAAVRLDERRAIVASLVEQYGASCRATGGLFSGEAFLRAIESIERGKHAS